MSENALNKLKRLETSLLSKYAADGEERGGLITADGKLIELENVADEPTEGYLPSLDLEDLDALDTAAGTWHTHPGATANLSAEDWQTFISWPDLSHVIVGSDGPRWYRVENGAVINA